MLKLPQTIFAIATTLTLGCRTYTYHPGTYSEAIDHFAIHSQTFTDKNLEVSCHHRDEHKLIWDQRMCEHLRSLLEQAGARVQVSNEDAITESAIKINVVHELKWLEESQFDFFLNVMTYGCYPTSVNRWYEAEVIASFEGETLEHSRFKAYWQQSTSWCKYIFETALSLVTDTKTKSDYLKLNTQDFDRFVAHLAYAAHAQIDWRQAKKAQNL